MRAHFFLFMGSIFFFSSTSLSNDYNRLDDFARTAALGRSADRQSLFQHHWNIKPATTTKSEAFTLWTVSGLLDHNVRFRDDNDISYRIRYRSGVLEEIMISLNQGPMRPVSSDCIASFGRFFLQSRIEENSLPGIIRNVEQMRDQHWNQAAEKIVCGMAAIFYGRYQSELKASFERAADAVKDPRLSFAGWYQGKSWRIEDQRINVRAGVRFYTGTLLLDRSLTFDYHYDYWIEMENGVIKSVRLRDAELPQLFKDIFGRYYGSMSMSTLSRWGIMTRLDAIDVSTNSDVGHKLMALIASQL